MEQIYETAKRAVESLFWDSCRIETYREEKTDWGETLHARQEGEDFPCRLREGAKVCGENGLLAQAEQTAQLFYPKEREIPAGSAVVIRGEDGEERRYIAAGESQSYRTHKSCRLKRRKII